MKLKENQLEIRIFITTLLFGALYENQGTIQPTNLI